MNNNTRIALAGLLSATGAFINAFAAEIVGNGVPKASALAEAPTKPKKAPKAEKPAVENLADPTPETPVEPAEATEGAKTYEELKALIEPLVKGGQGADVKTVIAKYGENLKDLATKPEHHAAFEKDLAALSY